MKVIIFTSMIRMILKFKLRTLNSIIKQMVVVLAATILFVIVPFASLANQNNTVVLDRAYGRFEVFRDSVGFILENPESIKKISLLNGSIQGELKLENKLKLEDVKSSIRSVYCGFEFLASVKNHDYKEFTLANLDIVGDNMYVICHVQMPVKMPTFFNGKLYLNNISFRKFPILITYNILNDSIERINIEYSYLGVDEIDGLHSMGFVMLDSVTYAIYNYHETYSILVYKISRDGLFRVIRSSKLGDYEMSQKNNIPQILSKSYGVGGSEYGVVCGSKLIDFDQNKDNSTKLLSVKKNEVIFKHFNNGEKNGNVFVLADRKKNGQYSIRTDIAFLEDDFDWKNVINLTFSSKKFYIIRKIAGDEYKLESYTIT